MASTVSGPPRATYTSTEARTHWRDIMNASAQGVPVTISRHDSSASAVTDAGILRNYLAQSLVPRTVTFVEDDVHVLVLKRRGFASDGDTLEAAIDDMVLQLREYAEDWGEHYSAAPNHADNWALVQLIALSSDTQLREWLIGGK